MLQFFPRAANSRALVPQSYATRVARHARSLLLTAPPASQACLQSPIINRVLLQNKRGYLRYCLRRSSVLSTKRPKVLGEFSSAANSSMSSRCLRAAGKTGLGCEYRARRWLAVKILPGANLSGHFKLEMHEEVTPAATVDSLHALSAHDEACRWLGSGGHCKLHHTLERQHVYLCPEHHLPRQCEGSSATARGWRSQTF